MLQPRNALPILSWYGDTEDRALAEALEDLENLSREEDFPAAIPRLITQRRCEAEVSSGSMPPVVQSIPTSPNVRINDRGVYNSPRNINPEARLWPESVIS